LPPDLKKIFDDTFKEASEFKKTITQDREMKTPWVMMSEKPSVKFKWLTEEERNVFKKACMPVWDKFRGDIPDEFFEAAEKTRKQQ
jgi:TRAP-type C4-dicarboxylate transport system substrate-binding protein